MVSIWYAEVCSVSRDAGTGPLNGLVQWEALQMNPGHAQMVAVIECRRWQPAGEEGFEEDVVGEVAGSVHLHRKDVC